MLVGKTEQALSFTGHEIFTLLLSGFVVGMFFGLAVAAYA